jgi:predicted 2-oxoglutarate/Fe(II)-dependent dioxygenase YbiX
MRLNQTIRGDKDVAGLLGLYHNLLRMWSDT